MNSGISHIRGEHVRGYALIDVPYVRVFHSPVPDAPHPSSFAPYRLSLIHI